LEKYKIFDLNVETISNLPVFVFAFTCHQNVCVVAFSIFIYGSLAKLFSIYNDLHGDREAVNIVVIGSNLLALSVYILISYCGYLTFANEIQNNIILNCMSCLANKFAVVSVLTM
jgi:amino acid permease